MSSEEAVPVDLYIYDLTLGMAKILSPSVIGQQVDGVWHTSIVVYDREYFFGQGGVTSCSPGSTSLGAPHTVERLGQTFVPFSVFMDYLQGLATTSYTGASYHLLEHNCNHFSEEVAGFLCGAHVPKHVLAQAAVLPAPLRAAVTALLSQALPSDTQASYGGGVRHSRADSPDFLTLNDQIEEARVHAAELSQRRATLADKLARRQRRKDKKRRHQNGEQDISEEMADAVEVESAAAVAGAAEVVAARAGGSAGGCALDERRELEEQRRLLHPPIIYSDIDVVAEFEQLAAALEGVSLAADEQQSVDELRQYLVQGEGSWVLGDDFLQFVGNVLSEERFSDLARLALLRCLAGAALRDDAALLLHADRRRHALLAHAQRIDALPTEQQAAILTLLCNLFAHVSSSEWLLYISEWEDAAGRVLSNIRVTTKVCVHGVVSSDPALVELGTALLYNLAGKEVKTVRLGRDLALRSLLPKGAKSKVFDEVCVELALAALQLLGAARPSEEHAHRALRALAALAAHAHDAAQVIALVGPSPAAFRGMSARVDEQIDLIMAKLK